MKAVELESKITGKPAYDLVNLRYRLEELEGKASHPELDSEEKIADRETLMEIHAYSCSDPLAYIKYIKSTGEIKAYSKEKIVNAYFEFPLRTIYEDIIGREDEDKEKIFRYKIKKEQALTAFSQIEVLIVLGLNNFEIGQIIAADEYDHEKKHYKKSLERKRELMTEKEITPEKLNAMVLRFRLETVHKAIKARNIAKEILEKHIKI